MDSSPGRTTGGSKEDITVTNPSSTRGCESMRFIKGSCTGGLTGCVWANATAGEKIQEPTPKLLHRRINLQSSKFIEARREFRCSAFELAWSLGARTCAITRLAANGRWVVLAPRGSWAGADR